ncbi:ribosomal oxygenase 1 [Monomorium pharaonis]|uniref:ribosomal oxygenase 1 n=1 Tax=Monomorium pharaonis TaxID=307658 RepID=UPI0017473FEE|nr:ribosomal oxygenase 1 [Monomorium pharaonis]
MREVTAYVHVAVWFFAPICIKKVNMEAVSAFSVYAAKEKNTAQLLNGKKNKQKSSKVLNQKNRKNVKQTSANQQVQRKERIKSKTKVNINDSIQPINKLNENRNMRRKLKLKAMRKKNLKKKTTQTNLAMKNSRAESNKNNLKSNHSDLNQSDLNQSDSSNTSIEINEKNSDDSNPITTSRKILQWLLYPIDIEHFFEHNWEKIPTYVKRGIPKYYKRIVSTPVIDDVLRKNHLLFGKNIDITSYSNGMRETHNSSGRAVASVVWDYYQNKCSVRMLNPQTFIPAIHALNATLQEYFGCFVGANLYLTPPNSQGFAPHYDDVEAFILQIEGQKRWRLYKPLNENEYLPRYSSKNFNQLEIGNPILDTVIKAGDLLYLPRGTIHQGMTLDTHSLHVTISVYQKNSWCDFLEKALPQALKRATENDIRFREGLPLDYLKYVGTAYQANDQKYIFKNKIKNLITLMLKYIDIDNAADLMAKNHIHDFLPPFLFEDERECTVAEGGEIMTNNGVIKNCVEITLETKIRLLRSHCIRLVKEDGIYKIYYSTENSKEYHEYEPQFLEIDEEFVLGIKQIVLCYPAFISVKELRIEDDDTKIQIVKDLWEKGLILMKNLLC